MVPENIADKRSLIGRRFFSTQRKSPSGQPVAETQVMRFESTSEKALQQSRGEVEAWLKQQGVSMSSSH